MRETGRQRNDQRQKQKNKGRGKDLPIQTMGQITESMARGCKVLFFK